MYGFNFCAILKCVTFCSCDFHNYYNYFNTLCLAFRFPVDKELDGRTPTVSLLNSRSLADKARLQLCLYHLPHASAWISWIGDGYHSAVEKIGAWGPEALSAIRGNTHTSMVAAEWLNIG